METVKVKSTQELETEFHNTIMAINKLDYELEFVYMQEIGGDTKVKMDGYEDAVKRLAELEKLAYELDDELYNRKRN